MICCFSWICRLNPHFSSVQVVLLNQVTTKFTEGSFQLTLALGSLLVPAVLLQSFSSDFHLSGTQLFFDSCIALLIYVVKTCGYHRQFSTFCMLLWMNNLLLLNGQICSVADIEFTWLWDAFYSAYLWSIFNTTYMEEASRLLDYVTYVLEVWVKIEL